MYYEKQINEIKKVYNFLEQFNDYTIGFNWSIAERDLNDYDTTYLDTLDGMTVSEAIEYLRDNFDGDEEIVGTEDGSYIEKVLKVVQTDKEYLDYIANSFDFKSEYNLSQSWVNNALWYDDQILHNMAFDLTNRRFNILTSFKDKTLIEAEYIVFFLLDKEAYRHRVANLYTFCGKEWDETETEKKLRDINLEAFVTFEQLKVV